MQPTPVFLPGEPRGQRSPVGCCSWGRTESDTTEATAAANQESSSHSLRVSWPVRGRATIKIQALGTSLVVQWLKLEQGAWDQSLVKELYPA